MFILLLLVSLFFSFVLCALWKTHAYFIIYCLKCFASPAISICFFFSTFFLLFRCDFDSRNCYRCPLFCCVYMLLLLLLYFFFVFCNSCARFDWSIYFYPVSLCVSVQNIKPLVNSLHQYFQFFAYFFFLLRSFICFVFCDDIIFFFLCKWYRTRQKKTTSMTETLLINHWVFFFIHLLWYFFSLLISSLQIKEPRYFFPSSSVDFAFMTKNNNKITAN